MKIATMHFRRDGSVGWPSNRCVGGRLYNLVRWLPSIVDNAAALSGRPRRIARHAAATMGRPFTNNLERAICQVNLPLRLHSKTRSRFCAAAETLFDQSPVHIALHRVKTRALLLLRIPCQRGSL